MKFDQELIEGGVIEVLDLIDNGLDTVRSYSKPWDTVMNMQSESDDHMHVMYEFERQVLVRVAQKLKEIYDV